MASLRGLLLQGISSSKTSLLNTRAAATSSNNSVSSFIRCASTTTAQSPQGQPAPGRIEKTVNQVTLMGRVGGDPQKRGSAEHPVVVFSLATHANYNYQDGGMLQKTDWHRVCVFKPYLRENVYKFMSKGQRVYVTGKISYGEVKDEQGNAHTATSVIADDVIFITDANKNRSVPED